MTSSINNIGANAARRFVDVNAAKANTATEQLASGLIVSNPSYDPSAAAVGYNLSANIQSLQQASRNVTQAIAVIQMATGFLGASSDVLIRMKQLTVAAANDTIGTAQREMMNQEFQQLLTQIDLNATNARWGGISLFDGGAGDVTAKLAQAAADMSGGISEATVTTPPTITFFAADGSAFNAGSSQGFIDGAATEAKVTKDGNLYQVSIKVGEQTFSGTTDGLAASGKMILTSTTNASNAIAFNIAADFTNAAAAQTQLNYMLGIGLGANATFSSASTDLTGITVANITAGAATTPGTWALSYDNSTGIFNLTNGIEKYTAQVSSTTAPALTETVTFSNGMTINLNAFTPANIPQALIEVAEGTSITQSFQYAEKSTDTLSVTFSGANLQSLGLVGLDIKTSANAAKASSAIDIAQQNLGAQIGQLGGKASEFKFMVDTLRINIQNTQAAKSTFTDADIAQSMQDLQTYSGLGQIAQSVFTKALNDQANLVQMVQSVR